MVAGFAQNFTMLAISRMGVGVGEAGCTPTAHSLIAEYFPKGSRARAMSIYSMGISIGSLLGMALGGLIADSYGWRVAFFIAGAPGLVFAVMAALTLVEPRRKRLKSDLAKAAGAAQMPISAALRVLAGKPTFWFMALGAAFASSVSYAHQLLPVVLLPPEPHGRPDPGCRAVRSQADGLPWPLHRICRRPWRRHRRVRRRMVVAGSARRTLVTS